jgi:hypothetical protein
MGTIMRNYVLLSILILSMAFLVVPVPSYSISPRMHTVIARPDCNKCHAEIQPLLSQQHSNIGCVGCHENDNRTHAANIANCSSCHVPIHMDIHQTSYPICSECHLDHGKLKDGYGHNNATFMQTHPCTSCHNMHG